MPEEKKDRTRPAKPSAKKHLHRFGYYSSAQTSTIALWFEKWCPRVLSSIVLLFIITLYVIIYPFIAVVALVIDLVRFPKVGGMNISRSFLFFLAYLFIVEVAGVTMFFALYVWKLVTFPSREQWLQKNYEFQNIWGQKMIFEMIRKVLGFKVRVEFIPDLTPGPKILFMRHVSFADTLIPQGIFSDRFQLRYILKKELLWDPAFNVVGSRTIQFFLDREAGPDIETEMQGISNLMVDITPLTLIAIWPEGTRFTPGKRKKVLASLEKKDPFAYENAKQLNHTLLPRTGGTLALLESNPGADALFCAHYGLEGASDFYEMATGKMVNRTLHLRVERVPFEDIPKTKDERVRWLYDHWKKMDKWIGTMAAEEEKKKEK